MPKMKEKLNLNGEAKSIDGTPRSLEQADTHAIMPAIIPTRQQQTVDDEDRMPVVQDAVAEEISEPEKKAEQESLNLESQYRHMLEKALEKNGGNRRKAAQELGISERTLFRRIKQYGLDV